MTAALVAWRDDPSVHAVVVEGAGGRAFCAGGDIRAIRAFAMAGQHDKVAEFFSTEYALNAMIDEYSKPYISIIDGVCMGGGIGLSVHGDMRVTSEASLFAMPETGIALFPDVGATFMLPRLPGALGMYLGLTGARLNGADAVHAGLATHFVPKAEIATLADAIAEDGPAAVAARAQSLPPFSLAPHRAAIDRCFGLDSVAAIEAALQAEGTEWAHETLHALHHGSPSAVMWSFEAMRRGARLSLRGALAAALGEEKGREAIRAQGNDPDFRAGAEARAALSAALNPNGPIADNQSWPHPTCRMVGSQHRPDPPQHRRCQAGNPPIGLSELPAPSPASIGIRTIFQAV
jgi:enoyl-CoA hydratase/carnithine racemase